MRVQATNDTPLPGRSPRLFRLFRRYVEQYMARHFHALRVSRTGPLPELPDRPVVVVLNHPSWWDPMVGVALTDAMPAYRAHFAPIEQVGLSQYRFLAKLGFFGFDSGTAAGARRFLMTSRAILARPESVLWITAEGAFVDARRRPISLRPGIGHLAHRLTDATILPMAVEYPFWDDRCPEILVRFGHPIHVQAGGERSARGWTALIERELHDTLERLAEESMCRDPGLFATMLKGTAGVGGVYDIGRRIRTWFGGTKFLAEHSSRPGIGAASRTPLDPSRAEVGRNVPR